VIAVRGLVASILGASQFDLPPDQRLYVGGSGTVRGYEYQSIGPLFPSGNPIGATAADSASIEFRQRIGNDWGAAAFVDAGQASETRTPFAGRPFVGVGAGVRYYTSIGPIRADIAIPLSKPLHGDAFEIYIGLGQSF
jgi:translocation and assembly module TamA